MKDEFKKIIKDTLIEYSYDNDAQVINMTSEVSQNLLAEAIEERIEIPVRKIFLLENSVILAHLQVDLNEHAGELISSIHERWESSDELKQIKEMGYDVRLGVMGDNVGGSTIYLTKELL